MTMNEGDILPATLRDEAPCPRCGEDEYIIIKDVDEYSKKLTLRCNSCGKTYNPSCYPTLGDFAPEGVRT